MNYMYDSASIFVIQDGSLRITPDMARYILENFNFDKQRRIDLPHVKALAEQMKRDQFEPGTQILFGRLPDGSLHLINAQHRLNAVILANQPQEFQVRINNYGTYDRLCTAYRRLDSLQRTRSKEVILGVSGVREREGVRSHVASGAYTAAALLANGLKNVSNAKMAPHLKTSDGRLDAVDPYWAQVRAYQDCMEGAEVRVQSKLRSGAVMAIALLTLQQCPEDAKKFWAGVANGVGLQRGDPRRTLNVELMGRANTRNPNALLHACAHAWNAWMDGRTLATIRVHEGTKLVLRGVKLPR